MSMELKAARDVYIDVAGWTCSFPKRILIISALAFGRESVY